MTRKEEFKQAIPYYIIMIILWTVVQVALFSI